MFTPFKHVLSLFLAGKSKVHSNTRVFLKGHWRTDRDRDGPYHGGHGGKGPGPGPAGGGGAGIAV